MENVEELLKRITVNPGIFAGKAIIRGMRFRVIDVLEMLGSGMTREEILENHPILETEDISACLYYAVQQPTPLRPKAGSNNNLLITK